MTPKSILLGMQSGLLAIDASLSRAWNPKKRKSAIVPAGCRIYAIGDVHGCLDLLQRIWRLIESDIAGSNLRIKVVLLGDYIDRGPDSRGVVDFLLSARLPNSEIIYLRGNHDQSLLDFIADPSYYRLWRAFGAAATLASYGVAPPHFDREADYARARTELLRKCPSDHISFFEHLRPYYMIGDCLFVHAGIRPGIALRRQNHHDLLWIRDQFLNSEQMFDKLIIHGHSPSIRPVRRRNRIGLDTGAYATGCLTAGVFQGGECRFLST